jgi:hypothetical protein
LVSRASVACLVLAAVFALVIVPAPASPDIDDAPVKVVASSVNTDPVAVIQPLPEIISNGTRYFLNGNQSYDLADDLVTKTNTIVNYTWEITHENNTIKVYGGQDWYRFQDLGLYKIKLTVRDMWGNTGVDFTAVLSVDDLDADGMPDWWELEYFGSMSQTASEDYDSDGYTNLHEWFEGTVPTVADPPPTIGFLEKNWPYLLVALVVVCALLAAMYPGMVKRRKAREAKKIEIALELEKTLEEE